MKNLPCDICGQDCAAASFDDWFKQMLSHWMSDHQAEMKAMQETGTKEEGEKWMADHKAQFEAADEA